MVAPGRPEYSQIPTPDLEAMLRNDPHGKDSGEISEELTRRYTELLLRPDPATSRAGAPGTPKSGQAPNPGNRNAGPPTPDHAPPAGQARPGPGQAPPPHPGRSKKKTAIASKKKAVIVVVMAAVALIIGVSIYVSNSPRVGSTCVTPTQSCRLSKNYPVGGGCECDTINGVDSGTIH
jgi:hypothetical protein